MADFVMKQHDTWPPLVAVLSDVNGPLDLTGATVKLILKPTTGSNIVGSCSIVAPAADGRVRYNWVVGDTAAVSAFTGEFEITWGDGTVGTVPNDSYFTLAVVADLG